jgi:hypothetical protein
MLIIADSRIPDEAKNNLRHYGEMIFIKTEGITYESISGHPDIFFCKLNDTIITAPNLPENYKLLLSERAIIFRDGEENVGDKYPKTAIYNAVFNGEYLIHNFRYTDSVINQNAGDTDLIHVNQGYCRCNLLPLKNNHFITSDEGIKKVLQNYHMEVLYVNPEDIILPDKKHGFFGGCCGVFGNKVFILGNLNFFGDGYKVGQFLSSLDYEIIELYDGPMFDGGSILCID